MNGRSAPPASAALTQELHDIVENDRYPLLAAHPHVEGHTRQAQARAGSRPLAAAEGSLPR
jgi:hypothetical protein